MNKHILIKGHLTIMKLNGENIHAVYNGFINEERFGITVLFGKDDYDFPVTLTYLRLAVGELIDLNPSGQTNFTLKISAIRHGSVTLELMNATEIRN